MVQTIAVSETALNDDMVPLGIPPALRWRPMVEGAYSCVFCVALCVLLPPPSTQFSFLLEDADAFGPETTSWWHPRVRLVERWLRDEANRAGIPDDGSEEMIRRHMQRGDIYPHVQLKCWKHILLELQDIPCFATRYADSARAANTSLSRGKIRPGKELIILSVDANGELRSSGKDENNSSKSDEPPLSDESSSQGDPSSSRSAITATTTATGSNSDSTITAGTTKKFSSLSMAERQAEWLRKKQEKMEAERVRQEEEKEKELTFQPKILRRSTLGDKPTRGTSATPQPPRMLQRSDTGGGGSGSSRKLDITGGAAESSKPSVGPKEKAIPRVPPRSAGRQRKKPLQSVPVSQPIEVSSDLLESMRSELMVSISKRAALSPTENSSIEPSSQKDDDSAETPDAAITAEPAEPLPLKSWSDQPVIGGRRIDFDSSETKARLVLQDAAQFALSTMYRKTDKKARRDGVALHMGRREDTFDEEVIAVLFDKEKVSELEAARWWCEHEHRFVEFMKELPKPMDFGLG